MFFWWFFNSVHASDPTLESIPESVLSTKLGFLVNSTHFVTSKFCGVLHLKKEHANGH